MDVQRKFLHLQFVDKIINLTLQSIREKDGWHYATFPEAGGAGFIGVDIQMCIRDRDWNKVKNLQALGGCFQILHCHSE